MKNIGRVSQIGVRIFFITFFALVVSGCITCVDCAKACPGTDTGVPVSCPMIAVDVGPNDPLGCAHNPGVSKKCNPNAPNKKCPSNIAGPGTCTTVGAPGNCSCTCQGG
jgi:hypothetical protein